MMQEKLMDTFLRKRTRNELAEVPEHWGIYESPIDSYIETFHELNLKETIHKLKRKRVYKETRAMDIMGAGQALRDLKEESAIDGGLSVTLGDFRSDYSREVDSTQNLEVVSGDILYGTTWRKISNWLKTQKDSTGFDLIVSRGEGGYQGIPYNLGLYELLFWRAFNLLNPDGGQLFSQIPAYGEKHEKERAAWVERVNSLPGVEVAYKSIPFTNRSYTHIIRVKRNQSEDYFDPEYKYTRHSLT